MTQEWEMSNVYRFEDWYGRQYDDPAIGLVEPGDVRELDAVPDDGHWTLVAVAPDSSEPAGNRGFQASDSDVPTTTPSGAVSGNDDNESESENPDTAEDSEQAKGDS